VVIGETLATTQAREACVGPMHRMLGLLFFIPTLGWVESTQTNGLDAKRATSREPRAGKIMSDVTATARRHI